MKTTPFKFSKPSAKNFILFAWLTWAASAASGAQAPTHDAGGGPPAPVTGECVSPAQRDHIEAIIRARPAFGGGGPGGSSGSGGPEAYPFVPIAGTAWQDRFINNFVDLNLASPAILDWDCTDFTYDGHHGHDIDLRSFGEQDIGVPVFAALDGTVADRHDGENDRNTQALGQPANYVVLQHAGTHYTWYYHLRKNSVAVTNGQIVRAATQLGLAASSGNSTGPHLHFESRNAGTYFEPSTGGCNAGMSGWVNQIPIRRDMWIEDFAVHNTNNFPATAFLPFNPSRKGTIVRTGSFQPIGCWYIIHNLPASSTWRVRYLRPNATVYFDSGAQNYQSGGNPFYRYATWWLYYNPTPDVAGVWTLELSVNGQVQVSARFTVLNIGGVPVNRPPNAITAAFDPPAPTTNDVIFCRLTTPLLADPDYDLMSYRFVWKTNGQNLRSVTNAAFSDAIPRLPPGIPLTCEVTPFDGQAFGSTVTNNVLIAGGPPVVLRTFLLASNQISIRWPTASVSYTLETTPVLTPPVPWLAVTNPPQALGGENAVNLPLANGQQFFRLRWP